MQHSLSDLYSVLLEAEGGLTQVVYKYTSEDDFAKIRNIPEMQLVYWGEIISRFHACSATTVVRLRKWYDAIEIAYKAPNYYGFCSSVRGLIEASADSFYTLGRTLYPIAQNFSHIRTALCGETLVPLFAQALEDDLIHYIFARKLSGNEKKSSPPSHSAKQVQEYLDCIKDEPVRELYAELCQVSHPSTMSLQPFMLEHQTYGLMFHTQNIDEELNKDLLRRHRPAIYTATLLALNTALCGLKLLNIFDIPFIESLKTNDDGLGALKSNPLWESIEGLVRDSLKGQQEREPDA